MKKQESSFSWKVWLNNQFDDPNPLFAVFVIVSLSALVLGLVASNIGFWAGFSCLGEPDTRVCTFNSHGYTFGIVFWTFLLITEAIFIVSLFWIKRKKDESVWHYTWVMKLYSMLFSILLGVVTYVVVLALSWVLNKFILVLPKIFSFIPKIIILVILHVWKPILFVIVLATIVGAWYLINTGLAKLFGSQDG